MLYKKEALPFLMYFSVDPKKPDNQSKVKWTDKRFGLLIKKLSQRQTIQKFKEIEID